MANNFAFHDWKYFYKLSNYLQEYIELETEQLKKEHEIVDFIKRILDLLGKEPILNNEKKEIYTFYYFNTLVNAIYKLLFNLMIELEQSYLRNARFVNKETAISKKNRDSDKWKIVVFHHPNALDREIAEERLNENEIRKIINVFASIRKMVKKNLEDSLKKDIETYQKSRIAEENRNEDIVMMMNSINSVRNIFGQVIKYFGAYEKILWKLILKERKNLGVTKRFYYRLKDILGM